MSGWMLAGIRRGPGPLIGTAVASLTAATLIVAAISTAAAAAQAPAGRLAGASVVVAGSTSVSVTTGSGQDASQESLPLPAYRGVPASLAQSLARVPGAAAAAGEDGFPNGTVRPGDVDLIAVTARPGISPDVLASRIRADLHGGQGYTIATGATRGQVRRAILTELAVCGAVGGALGWLPGAALGARCVRALAAHQMLPAGSAAWLSPWLLAIACGASALVAWLSGQVAARRGSRTPPARALRETAAERRWPNPIRVVLGVAAAGGSGTPAGYSEILVSGGTTAELARLAAGHPGLRVASRSVANAQSAQAAAQNSFANDLILGVLGLLSAVALVNTLVVTTVERRRVLRLLGRVGATRGQVAAVFGWQAVFVAGTGLVAGAAAGAVTLLTVTRAVTGSWTPFIPLAPAVGLVALVAALTAGAVMIPFGLMSRREPTLASG
jgi:hypothetical protein